MMGTLWSNFAEMKAKKAEDSDELIGQKLAGEMEYAEAGLYIIDKGRAQILE